MTEKPVSGAPTAPLRRRPSHELIACRARQLWRAYGEPVGRDEQIWLEAERELRGLRLGPAGAASTQPFGPGDRIPLDPAWAGSTAGRQTTASLRTH